MSVLQSIENGVATLTLNRPESRNALNLDMCDRLISISREIQINEEIRLVLVRANGPVFCAGADLKERQGMNETQVRERRMKGFAAYAALEGLPMPTIAVVQGPAVGSGCEIVGACDFIVATPEASFRTPEALRGTVGATQRLPRILGKRLAKDLMFTGRALSAEEAGVAGLVSRVVSRSDLDSTLEQITKIILNAPPQSLRLAKRCIDGGVELDPQGALDTEIAAIEGQLASGNWMGKQ
ncbi:MAG: enoyl-CoA hydratase/isomerase family protein [Betaproteobacteria bacterium]|nr:enoyl-CoA hydratase/isomerase family protein [Betaproteobacteria bacterium]